MATYYVRPDGNNANAGTSPGTTGAWATLAKALHSGTPVTSGDTIYVAPGTYREVITINPTPASLLSIIGDYAASQFSDLDGGEVRWSAYTTNDTTAPSGSPCLNLNGKSNILVEGFVFVGGQGTVVTSACIHSTSGSVNITIRKCVLYTGRVGATSNAVSLLAPTVDVAANWLVEQCVIHAGYNGNGLNLSLSSSASAEYDAGVVIRNNLFLSGGIGNAILLSKGGANTFPAGGVTIDHNTFLGGQVSVSFSTARNFRYPVVLTHNTTMMMATSIVGPGAGADGAVLEDLNRFSGNASRSNVLAGAGTIADASYAQLLSLGHEHLYGMRPRAFLSPMTGSPNLNWSNHRLAHGVAGTAADDTAVGSVGWTNPGNTTGSDDTRAVASSVPATTGISYYLKLTNFGLSIPAGATVTGVRVDWERSASAGSAISLNSIKLVKGGAVVGSEMVGSDTAQWGTTDTTVTVGGPTNLWGTTISQAEATASDFGVAISAKNTSGGAQDARIDFVRLIVFYTTSAADGVTSVDLHGNPRPQGAAQSGAVGALERPNTATKNNSTYHTDPPGATITGYGFQDFEVPVAAALTELRMWMSKNASYAGSAPQLQVLNGEECGVSPTSASMTVGADTWEQVTVSVTPTRAGIVTLRVLSRSSAAAGAVTFDDAEIS